MRCPTDPATPSGELHTTVGCGSLNVVEGDDGLWDCLDCGIFFNPASEARAVKPRLIVLCRECGPSLSIQVDYGQVPDSKAWADLVENLTEDTAPAAHEYHDSITTEWVQSVTKLGNRDD